MTARSTDLGEELQRVAGAEPDRLALSDAHEDLTYGEMLADARALAASLPAGSADRRPVAMLMPSNARVVVGIFASLISGRPYCVLNPAQPRRRLEALLGAVDPSVVWVADRDQREKLRAVGLPAVGATPAGEPEEEPWQAPAAGDGICGVYVTSGSSGSPKVVGYRHEATYHRVGQYFAGVPEGGPGDLGSGHRFALASPLWAAAGASAMFAALFSRAQLHLFDPGVSKTSALAERLRSSEPTVWHSSPSAFRSLAGSGALDGNRFGVVRLTGEPVLASDVELAARICPDAWLIAAYGLTETNGIVTQRAIPLADAEAVARPLDSGFPLDGIELRIEGRDGSPLPTDTEGEIVIGGDYLSAGYLDAECTEKGTRFAPRDGASVFCTGDRGLVRSDGSLVVRGRDDRRVNIRGHRVDPSEVEVSALRIPGVLDSAVVPFRAGEDATALALFATVDPAGRADSQVIGAHLRQHLQSEAVPAHLKVVAALPRTPAGKVDRIRLATLAEEGVRRPASQAREGPLVAHLAILWSHALEIAQPEADEDFFALGGDSLAAAEVCTAIEDVYGVVLEPAALLDHRSPRALAAHVQEILDGAREAQASILRLNPSGSMDPLFVFPGAGSDATSLVHFAEAIGPEQPVFVIRLPGADGRGRPLSTMDAIAKHGISAIDESGVSSPYRVAGTSFGGLAAFHTAAALQADGREVDYLGLFDTPAPGTRSGHYLVRPFGHLKGAGILSPRSFAKDPRKWLSRSRKAFRRFLTDYRMTFRVLTGLRRSGVEHRLRHLRTGCEIAADRWTPQPLSLPVRLYRCDSQPDHLADAPRLGWDDLAPDMCVRTLRSRHNRHIRPPNVNQLAALVGDDLNGSGVPSQGDEPG